MNLKKVKKIFAQVSGWTNTTGLGPALAALLGWAHSWLRHWAGLSWAHSWLRHWAGPTPGCATGWRSGYCYI